MGGIVSTGENGRPAHFDFGQSTTGNNLRPQSKMFNSLLRYSPFDGARTIIPSLAHTWKVSDDNLSFNFSLREGVKFHDGAVLTSEDVVATFSRVIFPPEGIVSGRQELYSTVTEVKAIDPLTVEFVMSEPSAIFIPAVALDWSGIVRKQTLEDNNQDLRRVRDYPGTGPFRFEDFITDEVWTFERHEDYFEEGLPYLDGMRLVVAQGPTMFALLLAERIDYGNNIDVGAHQDMLDAGLTLEKYTTPVVFAAWMNLEKPPFDDVRVRRAIDLIADRHALLETTKHLKERMIGRWAFPRTQFSLSDEDLLKVPAYRPDKTEAIKEAKRLMAEAGYPDGFSIDFPTRDSTTMTPYAIALQEMMKRHLNIESTIRPVDRGVWYEELARGDFQITIGAIGAPLADPAVHLPGFYGSEGGQNLSKWKNQEFDDIMVKLVRELDPKRRDELVQQALDVIEEGVPIIEVAYAVTSHAWHPYVKDVPNRDQAGAYQLQKWDVVWIDK